MTRHDEQLEQIRRDARQDAIANPAPEPTIEQMRQVGDVLRPALDRLRDERTGSSEAGAA